MLLLYTSAWALQGLFWDYFWAERILDRGSISTLVGPYILGNKRNQKKSKYQKKQISQKINPNKIKPRPN